MFEFRHLDFVSSHTIAERGVFWCWKTGIFNKKEEASEEKSITHEVSSFQFKLHVNLRIILYVNMIFFEIVRPFKYLPKQGRVVVFET